MGYKSAADGVTSKGKTNDDMKAIGRNEAKIKANGK